MTVSVENRRLGQLTDLSERSLIALDFIQEGRSWVEWAIHHPTASYHFQDETALVIGIQEGIHATPFVLVTGLGLLVGPARLMALPDRELFAVAEARGETAGGGSAGERARHIIRSHGLVTAEELASLPAYLQDIGVGDAAVFQAMQLDEQLALLGLFRRSAGDERLPADFHDEAAGFAVEQARAPLEFVDYFTAYLGYVAKVASMSHRRGQRLGMAREAVRTLKPFLLDSLDCPRVERRAHPWEVRATIGEWLLTGRRLGFPRLSAAVQQTLCHSGYRGEKGAAAAKIVAHYVEGAQSMLRTTPLEPGPLAQDGASRLFTAREDDRAIAVELAANGLITLRGFRDASDEKAGSGKAKGAERDSGKTIQEKKHAHKN